MSAEELLEMTSSPLLAITDPRKVRDKIHEEFDAAKSSEERGALLALFIATFNITEKNLAKNAPEKLAEFQKARAQDYNLFLVKECTVGLDSPGGGDVSVEAMKIATDREVAAGRMTEDHELRKLAVQGCAAPHLTHAQLIEKHAKLQAAAAVPAPKTLGQKLKGLFGK